LSAPRGWKSLPAREPRYVATLDFDRSGRLYTVWSEGPVLRGSPGIPVEKHEVLDGFPPWITRFRCSPTGPAIALITQEAAYLKLDRDTPPRELGRSDELLRNGSIPLDLAWSDDGQQLAVMDDFGITLFDAGGKFVRQLHARTESSMHGGLSWAGERLISSDNRGIFVHEPDGATRFTPLPASDTPIEGTGRCAVEPGCQRAIVALCGQIWGNRGGLAVIDVVSGEICLPARVTYVHTKSPLAFSPSGDAFAVLDMTCGLFVAPWSETVAPDEDSEFLSGVVTMLDSGRAEEALAALDKRKVRPGLANTVDFLRGRARSQVDHRRKQAKLNACASALQVGNTVVHSKFGKGTILAMNDGGKATVDFAGTTKVLDASFLRRPVES